jgi:hypothetical protein
MSLPAILVPDERLGTNETVLDHHHKQVPPMAQGRNRLDVSAKGHLSEKRNIVAA